MASSDTPAPVANATGQATPPQIGDYTAEQLNEMAKAQVKAATQPATPNVAQPSNEPSPNDYTPEQLLNIAGATNPSVTPNASQPATLPGAAYQMPTAPQISLQDCAAFGIAAALITGLLFVLIKAIDRDRDEPSSSNIIATIRCLNDLARASRDIFRFLLRCILIIAEWCFWMAIFILGQKFGLAGTIITVGVWVCIYRRRLFRVLCEFVGWFVAGL